MPHKREKYVPKHRSAAAPLIAAQAPRKVLRNTVVMSSVAVAATAGGITTGVAGTPVSVSAAAQVGDSVPPSAGGELAERSAPVSRSDRRDVSDPVKEAALSQEDGPAVTRTEDLSDRDPRSVARALLPQFGFSADQFGCLDALWVSESDWRINADNPTSSAYGIPQALTELHDLPADYMTSAEAQIRWGLGYIQDSYGSPCSAWSFKQANNWY
jgi:hypothetical protein